MHSDFLLCWVEPGALSMLGKRSTTERLPSRYLITYNHHMEAIRRPISSNMISTLCAVLSHGFRDLNILF